MTDKTHRRLVVSMFGALLVVWAIGVVFQLSVLSANRFYMPVDTGDYHGFKQYMIQNPEQKTFLFKKHQPMSDKTKLNFLGDKYYMVIGDGVLFYSIGDAMVVLGAVGCTLVFSGALAVDFCQALSRERNCED